MAIGATHRRVVLVFMKEGFSLVVIGGMLGLGAAAFASRLLRAIIFGIHPLDSVTFAAGAALLLAVTGLAVVVPALRAARVDPMIALRAE
jgi:ABC-type antimicrobial peptide transport system permease subunit